MIATIQHGTTGWGDYVLYGTKNKPRDEKKIATGSSDIKAGDLICEGGYYSIVLGFKGRLSNKKAYRIMREWEKLFMHGFNEEEYYLDYVIHQDTDDTHVHVRIADVNLFTGTKLKFYNDRTDRWRKEMIQRHLDEKFELESPEENKKLFIENMDEQIDNWREDGDFDALNHKNKKTRDEFRKKMQNRLEKLIKSGKVESHEQVIKFFESIGYAVANQGYDWSRNAHYLTVENRKRQKAKVYGEFYSPEFWNQSKKERLKKVEVNSTDVKEESLRTGIIEHLKKLKKRAVNSREKTNIQKRIDEKRQRFDYKKELAIQLEQAQERRKLFIDSHYTSARNKALIRLQEEALDIQFDMEEIDEWKAFEMMLNLDERMKKQEEERVRKEKTTCVQSHNRGLDKKEDIVDIPDDILDVELDNEPNVEVPLFNPIITKDIYKPSDEVFKKEFDDIGR